MWQCIDVSRHNGEIDFEKVKAAGIRNVIIRCGFTGYGKSHTLNKDDKFERNYQKAKQAGLAVGAYYYAVATTPADAEREAEFVLTLLRGKQFELPVYYDVEDNHDVNASNVYPENMQNIGKARLTAVVNRFCSIVESHGYFTGIYSSTWWFNNYLDMSVLNRYTVWLAQWAEKPTYKGPYAVWQYTSRGRVNGISGNVDMNEIYQDFPAIIKRAGLNGFKKEVVPAEPEETFLAGDVDGDGVVTAEDAMLILRRVVGLETFTERQEKAADMDGDGMITAADAREALRAAVLTEE